MEPNLLSPQLRSPGFTHLHAHETNADLIQGQLGMGLPNATNIINYA